MTKAFFITEDDAGVLRQIISDYRRRNRSLENNGVTIDDTDDQLTPEVYVIRVPFTGIPARTFVPIGFTGGYYVPGSAECEVWKIYPVDRGVDGILNNAMVKTHFTITVFNISDNSIYPAEEDGALVNEFRIARRDKFGKWVIECYPSCGFEPTGTGPTGTGTTGTGTTGTGTGTTGTGTTGTGITGTGITGTGTTGTGTSGTGTGVTGTGTAATGTGTSPYSCVCGIILPETPYVGQTADGECTADPPGENSCIGGCTYTWNGSSWDPTISCAQP